MRKPDRVEAKLDRLAELRVSADPKEIRPFLADSSNLVIAKAARIAGDLRLIECIPDLNATFKRLMRNPGALDKGCAALTAIAHALYAMDHDDSEVFLQGIRHVQMEPSWGLPVDAAVELRGACALGLVHTRYPHTIFELVRLLADAQWKARLTAAQALACTNQPAAAAVLQHKAMVGDDEPDVVGECFAGLLTIAPELYLPFVTGYIRGSNEPIAEAALLALGGARTPSSVRIVIDHWDKLVGPLRKAAIAALAMSRQEDALVFLLQRIEEEAETVAGQIAQALDTYQGSEGVRERVSNAMSRRSR